MVGWERLHRIYTMDRTERRVIEGAIGASFEQFRHPQSYHYAICERKQPPVSGSCPIPVPGSFSILRRGVFAKPRHTNRSARQRDFRFRKRRLQTPLARGPVKIRELAAAPVDDESWLGGVGGLLLRATWAGFGGRFFRFGLKLDRIGVVLGRLGRRSCPIRGHSRYRVLDRVGHRIRNPGTGHSTAELPARH